MKLPQLSPILCGWFFTSCPPNRQDNIQRQIVKKQGWGKDRVVGRFVNQGSDHSLHNNHDSSDTLLGQFVSPTEGISQQDKFGIVRTSEHSSGVEQPQHLTNSVLRGHFTQTHFPSDTGTRQEQSVYQQEAEEFSYQQQTFQDCEQDGFQPLDASSFDPLST